MTEDKYPVNAVLGFLSQRGWSLSSIHKDMVVLEKNGVHVKIDTTNLCEEYISTEISDPVCAVEHISEDIFWRHIKTIERSLCISYSKEIKNRLHKLNSNELSEVLSICCKYGGEDE